MAAKQVADKLISEHLVAVFSKSYCPYCKRAKQVIAGLNLESNKIGLLELDEMKEGPDVQDYLLQKTGQRTVPNIFINGKHLGGCDDILRAQQSGELEKLVGKL
ncbi:Glutaredoxin [Malassezia pachydermatis]